MKNKSFQNKLFSKFSFLFILVTFIILMIVFLNIKGEFYYAAINSVPDYISYYATKYLNNDFSKLFINNQLLMYIENDYQNIYSALYIYVVSFGNNIFKVFSFLLPIILFFKTNEFLYDEIHKKSAISKIVRIGKKKYINNTILFNGVLMGLLLVLPKLIYLLVLCVLFPVGISEIHFLGSTSFISQPYLYVGYGISPIYLIGVDLIISFLYGFLISLISIIITSIVSKKSMSYLLFIFTIGALSIFLILFKHAPIISYYSIFNYFEQITIDTLGVNIFLPLILILLGCIITYFITKIIFKKRLEKSL